MKMKSILPGLALLVISASAVSDDAIVMSLGGEVAQPRQWTMAELQAVPSEVITVADERGAASQYRCVAFQTLLDVAGAPSGKSIKGERLTDYILVIGGDGYRVLFALAEIDSSLGNRKAFLCHGKDNMALPPEEGPLRVVMPGEERHARWVRNAVRIDLNRMPR